MIILNGKLTPEGLTTSNSFTIHSLKELEQYVEQVGFLPLFKNTVSGFSLEEHTLSASWWGGNSDADPWEWRNHISALENITYGKFFNKKAGFISKKWFSYFVALRRDGYDFDSRYEDGLANRKQKKLFDYLEKNGSTTSKALKNGAGFGKDGEVGYETAITSLQMQTYIAIQGFEKKLTSTGAVKGHGSAVFCLAEQLWGEEYIRSSYELTLPYAKKTILENVQKYFPNAEEKFYLKELM